MLGRLSITLNLLIAKYTYIHLTILVDHMIVLVSVPIAGCNIQHVEFKEKMCNLARSLEKLVYCQLTFKEEYHAKRAWQSKTALFIGAEEQNGGTMLEKIR